MNIHEHQAKELFARHGIAVPRGIVAFGVEEAVRAAERLLAETGRSIVVVKAQIHAGGRGKAGGVRVCRGVQEARAAAEALWGTTLVTRQTGPAGKKVQRLYVEEGVSIDREIYLALVLDRELRRVCVVACAEGGMDIEEVAARSPEKILRVVIDTALGPMPYQARQLAFGLGLGASMARPLESLLGALWRLYQSEDGSLVELNPLIVTGDGQLLALDAKIVLDDNAALRHAEWEGLRDSNEEHPVEARARQIGISYVDLDGDIGCLVNGAGLAMATMDMIQLAGGRPANFLDVGGGASREQVEQAFRIILTSPEVRGIFVNIFGGIMRCDLLAEGIVAASRSVGLQVPLVVRLEGTNVEQGRRILAESGLRLHTATTMAEGAHTIVRMVREGG